MKLMLIVLLLCCCGCKKTRNEFYVDHDGNRNKITRVYWGGVLRMHKHRVYNSETSHLTGTIYSREGDTILTWEAEDFYTRRLIYVDSKPYVTQTQTIGTNKLYTIGFYDGQESPQTTIIISEDGNVALQDVDYSEEIFHGKETSFGKTTLVSEIEYFLNGIKRLRKRVHTNTETGEKEETYYIVEAVNKNNGALCFIFINKDSSLVLKYDSKETNKTNFDGRIVIQEEIGLTYHYLTLACNDDKLDGHFKISSTGDINFAR